MNDRADIIAELAATFDYAVLDPAVRKVVQQRTRDIRARMGKSAENTRQLGEWLLEVKGLLGHGEFRKWLRSEGWKVTTAWRLMKVAEQFKCSNLEQMDIAPSALYLITDPSTPEDVREAILARAEAGEVITPLAVNAELQEYRSETNPPPPWNCREMLDAIYDAVTKLNDRCPTEHRKTMGERLMSLGKQIARNGGL